MGMGVSTPTAYRPSRLQPEAALAACAYNRVSKLTISKGEHRGYSVTRSVKRQAQDAERHAERMGLGPVTQFTDENYSASRFRTKERKDWPGFLDAIRSG